MPTSNLISASKFLGKDRYDYYLNELVTEKTLGGHQLSNAQLKEAFKKRTNKISFEKFVDKVISSKTVKASVNASPITAGGLGKKGGALVKSPVGGIQKIQISTDQKEVGVVGGYLKDIIGSLGNIIKVLNAGVSADIKNQEQKRRDRERSKRESVEKGLEKGFSAVKKVVEKVVAPVKSILSRIVDFFLKMFLARVVVKLIDWLADPKNASKVKSVIRFLGDWWPALLGSYILFGTSFGRFVRGITGLLARFIVQIGKVAIPGLLKFIARNRVGAAAAALLGVGAAAELVPGMTGQQEQKTKQAPGSTEDKIKALQQQKANLNIFQKMQGVGAEIDEQIFALQSGGAKSYGFSGGGFNGFVSGEKGVDKIPAMLSDGEFVMSAGAVQKYGVDTLEAMNAAGGGTNKPKIMNGTTYAVGGGPIGSRPGPESEKYSSNSSGDSIFDLRKHFNNFIKSRGAGPNFDIGNPSTWGGNRGGTSVSGGGGSGGFLSNLGFAGRIAGQVPVIANRELNRAGRIVNEGKKLAAPTLNRASRIVNEGKKLAAPTLNRAGKVVEGVKQKVGSTIDSVKNFDFKGLRALSSSISGAATEAIPALLSSTLGISGTDKSISEDMQRQLLQARATAAKRGRNYVDYKDYDGGGLLPGGFTAGGLTMGRIADKEWKRDAQGRIIGLRQVYDTNRSAKEAWNQGMEGFGQFGSSLMKGQLNKEALGRGIYKPFEALLALTQHRGKTMHDVNFSEKVLGFKPGQEVLSPTQKKMIAEQKNREALQDKRPWWDKMGLFGGASAQMQNEQKKKQEFLKKNPSAKLYDKPQKNTGEAYKSRFARPANAGKTGVKPPIKPKTTVVKVSGSGGSGGRASSSRNRRGTGSPGSIKASHPSGTANKQANLNIRNK